MEDKSALLDVRRTRESQDRLRELVGLVTAFRDDEEARNEGQLIEEIESKLHVDDWIGPLSASLEMWELKDQVFQRRGPRFVSRIMIIDDAGGGFDGCERIPVIPPADVDKKTSPTKKLPAHCQPHLTLGPRKNHRRLSWRSEYGVHTVPSTLQDKI